MTVVVGAGSSPTASQISGAFSQSVSSVQPFASIQVAEPPSKSAKVVGIIVLIGGVLAVELKKQLVFLAEVIVLASVCVVLRLPAQQT